MGREAERVQLQVWATWLYYAVLIDLCEDVAEVLQLPLSRISVEMVARSLYFYVQAVDQGYIGDAATYLAQEAKPSYRQRVACYVLRVDRARNTQYATRNTAWDDVKTASP